MAVKSPEERGMCVDHECSHEFEIECSDECLGEKCTKEECLCDHEYENECGGACEEARQEQRCEDGECDHRSCAAERCGHSDIKLDDVSIDRDGDLSFDVSCRDCGATYSGYARPQDILRCDSDYPEWELPED